MPRSDEFARMKRKKRSWKAPAVRSARGASCGRRKENSSALEIAYRDRRQEARFPSPLG